MFVDLDADERHVVHGEQSTDVLDHGPLEIEEEETQVAKHFGVFGATLLTFFLAEMGDKTQIATVALAAHYANPPLVAIGTTLGCCWLTYLLCSLATSWRARSR